MFETYTTGLIFPNLEEASATVEEGGNYQKLRVEDVPRLNTRPHQFAVYSSIGTGSLAIILLVLGVATNHPVLWALLMVVAIAAYVAYSIEISLQKKAYNAKSNAITARYEEIFGQAKTAMSDAIKKARALPLSMQKQWHKLPNSQFQFMVIPCEETPVLVFGSDDGTQWYQVSKVTGPHWAAITNFLASLDSVCR